MSFCEEIMPVHGIAKRVLQGIEALAGQQQPPAVTLTVFYQGSQLGSFSIAWAQSLGGPNPRQTTVSPIAAASAQLPSGTRQYAVQVGTPLQFLARTKDANGTGLSQGVLCSRSQTSTLLQALRLMNEEVMQECESV